MNLLEGIKEVEEDKKDIRERSGRAAGEGRGI